MTASPTNGDPKVSSAILVAIAVVLLALPILLGLQTLYHAADRSDVEARSRPRVAQQEAGYEWIDRDKGVLRIPVQRAMDLIVQEASDKRARE